MHPRTAVRLAALACAGLVCSAPLAAQDEEVGGDTLSPCPVPHRSLDLPAPGHGLSLGNSARHTGIRINLVDRCVERVDRVNLTLWRPKDNPDLVVNGAAVGLLAPVARDINGVGVGGLAVITKGLRGIGAGGLGVIAGPAGWRRSRRAT